MKNIFLFILMSVMIFSCQDDEEILFNVDASEVEVSFKPINGGAVLYYKLPANPDIFGIQAEYVNSRGRKITKVGAYGADSLVLDGFIEEVKNVSVKIRLFDNENKYSKAIFKTINVLEDEALDVFNNLKVTSYWSGFKVSYEGKETAKGFLNIGFEGINPKTKEFDTLRIETLPISGEHQVYYTNANEETEYLNVVVWTDNYRGEELCTKYYKEVKVLKTRMLDGNNITVDGSSIEDENFGVRYLFDGDTKGINAFLSGESTVRYCFKSQRGAVDNSYTNVWDFDLKEEQEIAVVKIYCFLNSFREYSITHYGDAPPHRYNLEYSSAAHFEIYGTNDPFALLDECDKLGEYEESRYLPKEERWTWRSIDPKEKYTLNNIEEFKNAEGNYIAANCEVTGKKYRYLKLRVLNTHTTLRPLTGELNPNDGDFYMEELEILVKK